MSNAQLGNGNPFHPRSPAFGYMLLCLASLLVVFLVLLQERQTMLVNWVILLVGTGGLMVRMPLAPVLVLVLVAVGKLLSQMSLGMEYDFELPSAFNIGDVLLCAAVLGYVAGHFRLQALTSFILPPDPRVSASGKALVNKSIPSAPASGGVYPRRMDLWDKPGGSQANATASLRVCPRGSLRRSPALVLPGEQSLLVASLPFWALAAQLAWHWLARPRNVLEWSSRTAQLTVCLVVLAMGLVVAAAFIDYARRRRMTRDEAALLVQDTLWNETRGEQRWFTRWLAWFRLNGEGSNVLDP